MVLFNIYGYPELQEGNLSATIFFSGLGGINVVVVKNFRVPRGSLAAILMLKMKCSHIMIFQVSTGRSASLKDQSNFSSATGSSVGSWYGARYS
jgi:hypothetical protein